MTQQKVLYITPEVHPFLKLTSASEICAGLPKYIKEYGHEIRVVMPKYKSINDHKYVLRDVIRLKEVPVTVNGEDKVATVKSSFIPDSKVQIYFVEIPGFFKNNSFLNENNEISKESLRELAFFSKSVLELLKILCWYPDIIHTNEWQSGLLHYYLNEEYRMMDEYSSVKTIHSVHNLNAKGIVDKNDLDDLSIDPKQFDESSLLKYAIDDCEVLTLNNEESLMIYEEDDFYKEFVGKKRLEIIPHGYDDIVWNPQAKKMKQVYTADTLEQKDVNKKYLTHKKDLELIENAPVVVLNVDKDFKYLNEIEKWLESQEEKQIYIVLTSLDKDVNKKYDDFDIMGDNYVYLRSSTNDELKNYIAASEFYVNLCNRSFYNQRFAISAPFGTIISGERSEVFDQFVSYEEDEENFNSVLVNDIKDDFGLLLDTMIEVYKKHDIIEIQKRVINMLISWQPSGMRIGKIYDDLNHM